jgi:hypothetical protein
MYRDGDDDDEEEEENEGENSCWEREKGGVHIYFLSLDCNSAEECRYVLSCDIGYSCGKILLSVKRK